MDTTFEQARRCPRCESPGVEGPSRQGPHRSVMYTFHCHNDRCRWYTTSWVVQVNADGSIPPPDAYRLKQFPSVPDRTDAVNATMQKLLQDTLDNNSEVQWR